MKKVLIVRSNAIDPDSRVEKEANSLCNFGYDVTLLGWDRSSNYLQKKDEKLLSNHIINRFCIGAKAGFGEGFKSIIPFLKFQIILFFWLIKNHKKYDVFHFCDFDTAFTGSIVCKIVRKPYVFDIFDYLSTDATSMFKKIIKKLEDNIINNATATIICNEKRKQQISNSHPKKLVVIHNSPLQCDSREFACTDNQRIRIVYVGVLLEHRLIEEMLQAISENPLVELHIGGFGKYETIVESYSKKYDNIIYYGKIPYEKTIELEQKCDIMTAIYAPYIGNHIYAAPNKFYEGLMLGKPLIMVKNTGMSEYIEKCDLGVLINYSKEGFEKGIKKLCERKNEWNEISHRMKKIYQEEFSWIEMERRLGELYKQL